VSLLPLFPTFLSLREYISSKLSCLLLSVFTAYFLTTVFKPDFSDVMAATLVLIGLFCLKGSLKSLKKSPLGQLEQYLLVAFVVYAIVTIVSFSYWPSTRHGHMRLEDDIKFLFFIPLYMVLRQYQLRTRAILTVFIIFALLLGVVPIVQYIGISQYNEYWFKFDDAFRDHWRPSGSVNPMRYGVIALVLAGWLLNAKLVFKDKTWSLRFALLLGFVLALVGCFLTQTRGVWLAIPVLILAYLFYVFRMGRDRYIWVILLTSIVFLVSLSQSNLVQKRLDITLSNLQQYQEGNGNSSLGARLDMYKFSLKLFTDNPIFGHGLGVFKTKAQEARIDGQLAGMSTELGKRRTPHNEFFQALVERGVIGLVVTIMLLIAPGVIFYKALKSRSRKSVYYGLNGIVLLIIFFVAGQTGTLFNHNVFTHFYIIMVLLFASQIRAEELKRHKKA
jgi:O-antigen ligase